MDVAVVESERRQSEYLRDSYVVYLVESRPIKHTLDPACALWRRYSEFELLHNYLIARYPYIVTPPLPEKRMNVSKLKITTDKFDPDFIERRRLGLESFVLRVASHPIFSQDSLFRGFLNKEEGWKESVASSQWKQDVDNRFRTINAIMAVKKSDPRFDGMTSECVNLNTNISALLKVQQRISNKISTSMKQYCEYGKLFEAWSSIETEIGDLMKHVGDQMNMLASQTKTMLNEEESAYIDQLKEYVYFTDSLRAIVQKQKLRQWNLEKAEDNLSTKSDQKAEILRRIHMLEAGEQLPSPSGVRFIYEMILGAETLEQKREKILILEEQVKEAEMMVVVAKEELNVFVEKSLKDFQRFRDQKVRDINDIMANYINTQLKVNKLGLQRWQAMKDCFMNM